MKNEPRNCKIEDGEKTFRPLSGLAGIFKAASMGLGLGLAVILNGNIVGRRSAALVAKSQ